MTVIVTRNVNNVISAPNTTAVNAGQNLTVGVRGLSAYQIAVQEGFVGTEAEWLESLNGADGTAVYYEHTQSSASDTWIINHNLGFKPSVSVFNSGGSEIECDVIHVSNNQCQISLVVAISGFARLV